ncbi:hypothetical protein GOP47_0022331 [Adiantum capillus-veneris]|uniref:Uncharacterized protein n=1 Tax=Adiantum capillus-veneris TaxID=13818 RepID=A0A9D4Z5Z0_ADICA|nr:hypothetical protein GOP47_0022331 [Adiantum capillus-veneris]
MPLAGRYVSAFRAESNLFFVMKSFAAGVILATAYVHMLPDSFKALGNECLAENPWANFPFAGFIAMVASLFVLMIDFFATTYYENKHQKSVGTVGAHGHDDPHKGKLTHINVHDDAKTDCSNHPDQAAHLSAVSVHAHTHGPHSHTLMLTEDETSKLRHRVISQVLELGIVAHSVIIGITLGTSESPCTIRPLLAALTFHQFFEGVALGSCIAQAGFKTRASMLMAFFFSITTPLGIGIGMGIASTYNENSPTALIVQGVFDSMSTGILLYMALVDLIAADFLSKRLRTNVHLQLYAYTALFLGVGAMSVIAYWA